MRIAVLTRYVHDAGGVEAYLRRVLPALQRGGHDLAVWYEFAIPEGRANQLSTVPCRMLDGVERSAREIAGWRPDVLFLNGLSEPSSEMQLTDRRPTVTFLHGYHGTCISGLKTRMLPTPSPCSRQLGPSCLLQYYPRRCGGLSPRVMFDGYAQQRLRQRLLRRSSFVATFSEHMRREAISHGVDATRAVHLPAFNPDGDATPNRTGPSERPAARASHLAFLGRLERAKGAHVLVEALALLDRDLRSRLRVTVAGDGREKESLMARASRISDVQVTFPGWIDPSERAELFSTVDLLVVPSIWPEPLGLVGLEAAAAGVPAVAFDVGGIRDWLEDNVTGRLVRASPPSSAALADAIADALGDRQRLLAWSRSARERSGRLTVEAHVTALEQVLRRAAQEGAPA